MNWRVTISNPLNTQVLNVFENGARMPDGEIGIRRFDPPTVVPPGISKALNLYVKQTVTQVPPRAIVQLHLDDQPVFWGPVVISPPLVAPGAGPADHDRDALERVTVVGGEQLLKDSIVGPRLMDKVSLNNPDAHDPAWMAYELCRLYAHPALTVDLANFKMTGTRVPVFYRPESTLQDSLKTLTDSVTDAVAWVNAAGAICYEAPS